MKPILFASDETDFTTNGMGRIDCLSCEVIEERNGIFELEAEVPVDGAHASEIGMLSIIGAVPSEGENIQAFVVYKITKPLNGRFKVYARHISYRLSDIPAMPFSIEASATACNSTLQGLKNNAVENCPFTFYTDVNTANSYNQKVPSSIRQRLGGIEGSVLDQFGGEYKWDNFTVSLLKSRGRLAVTTGITLRYGKNITDINQEEEIANTVTGVVPYWIDNEGENLITLPNGEVVYSDNHENYPYNLTVALDMSSYFQDKPTVNQLRSAANTYVHSTDFGVPKVSIKVSFVNLWETEEYKDIAPLERVKLCDEIYVYFEKLGINAIAKVVKTNYDVLKERYINIEVGSMRTTLAQAVTDRDKNVKEEFIKQMEKMNDVVSDATAWLTNSNGYVFARKNQDGTWKELFFMSSPNPYTANNGIRINENGIGFFSKAVHPQGDIINGPYDVAWTIDGKLGDFANKNFWNFLTGQFSLSADTTVGGSTVQAIANSAEAAAKTYADSIVSASERYLQDQIDGNITSYFKDYAPTMQNYPVSEWSQATDPVTEYKKHMGDLFYEEGTGYCYRFQVKSTAPSDPNQWTVNDFEWVQISDEDIAEAMRLAQEAQDTADGKRRTFVNDPDDPDTTKRLPVPPYDIGDIWVQGANGDILRCAHAREEGEHSYGLSDWVEASKYTDDTTVNNLNNSLDMDGIMNRLTHGLKTEGIYSENGHIYLNVSMAKIGKLLFDLMEGGMLTLGGDNNGSGVMVAMGTPSVKVNSSLGPGDSISHSWVPITKVKTWINVVGATDVPVGQYKLGNGNWTDLYAGVTNFGIDKTDITLSNGTSSSFSYTIYEAEAITTIDEYGVKTSNIEATGSGKIGDLNLANGEIYDTGDYIIAKQSVYSISNLYTFYLADFYPTELFIEQIVRGLSTFQISVTFNMSTSAAYSSVTCQLVRFAPNYEKVEEIETYSPTAGNDYTITFNTSISVYSSYEWRVDIQAYDPNHSSYSIDAVAFISNARVISLSGDGNYGIFNGNHQGSASLSNCDTKKLRINRRGSSDFIVSEGYDIRRYESSSDTLYYARWSISSDRRLKENIKDIDTKLSIDLINAIQPKQFYFRKRPEKHYGMIAQEVREILENLKEKDAHLEYSQGDLNVDDQRAIEYEEFVPHLINYVKDLTAQMEALKSEVDTIKKGLSNCETQ